MIAYSYLVSDLSDKRQTRILEKCNTHFSAENIVNRAPIISPIIYRVTLNARISATDRGIGTKQNGASTAYFPQSPEHVSTTFHILFSFSTYYNRTFKFTFDHFWRIKKNRRNLSSGRSNRNVSSICKSLDWRDVRIALR